MTVPVPAKFRTKLVASEPDAVPLSVVKLPPVTPPPYVPPVIVADPLPDETAPVSSVLGMISVPVIVPAPAASVMVNGAFTEVAVMFVRETVAEKVPLPMLVSPAVPEAVMFVPDKAVVAVTVKLVLIVAACNPAQATKHTAKLAYLRIAWFIIFLPILR
jgi:hypothetical protein